MSIEQVQVEKPVKLELVVLKVFLLYENETSGHQTWSTYVLDQSAGSAPMYRDFFVPIVSVQHPHDEALGFWSA